jgi:hypothetical protein
VIPSFLESPESGFLRRYKRNLTIKILCKPYNY